MRNLKPVLLAILLIGFIWLGVHSIVNTNNKLHFKDIQLKSTTTDLLNLEVKYDTLNKNLQNELNAKDQNQQKIQELEQQKKDLENERNSLQSQLQARADAKSAAQQKIASAASLSPKVYAEGDSKMFIYTHESGNNPLAKNSLGCLGLGQACPGSKLLAVCPTLEYGCEDQFFTNYMLNRYGSWDAAKAYWVANHWW